MGGQLKPSLRSARWRRHGLRALRLVTAALVMIGLVVSVEALRYHDGVDGAALVAPEAATTRLVIPRDHARILFAGDTHFGEGYFHDSPRAGFLSQHGYAHPLHRLAPLLRSADLVVANLETPLSHRRHSALGALKTYIHWSDPKRSARQLAATNVHAVNLANDHSLDLSGVGLEHTVATLADHGLEAFGAGRSLAQAARPLRRDVVVGARTLPLATLGLFERQWTYWWYGFYATSGRPGVYGPTLRTAQAQLRALKASTPRLFVIVFPHWGDNYAWSTEEQRSFGHGLIDAGADLVIGHGAHVFQEVERYREHWILYNLGNFLFLSPGRYARRAIHPYSMAAALDLAERPDGIALALRLYFIASDNRKTGFVPHLLDGPAFDEAVRILLEGGSLAAQPRQQLRERAQPARDEIGAHLRLDLASWP